MLLPWKRHVRPSLPAKNVKYDTIKNPMRNNALFLYENFSENT